MTLSGRRPAGAASSFHFLATETSVDIVLVSATVYSFAPSSAVVAVVRSVYGELSAPCSRNSMGSCLPVAASMSVAGFGKLGISAVHCCAAVSVISWSLCPPTSTSSVMDSGRVAASSPSQPFVTRSFQMSSSPKISSPLLVMPPPLIPTLVALLFSIMTLATTPARAFASALGTDLKALLSVIGWPKGIGVFSPPSW